MAYNDRNFRYFSIRSLLGFATILMLAISTRVKVQPERAICLILDIVFSVAWLVQIVLMWVRPDWFKNKKPYDEIPGRVKRQSDKT